MKAPVLKRLRAICLDLPETEERETWDTPTFRVRDRIFAMCGHDGGRDSVWCKAPAGVQQILLAADASRFFAPPYVGPEGWIGIWLDRGVDWDEVRELVARSWRLTAPKRLVKQQGG